MDNDNIDFKKIIEKSREEKVKENWEGTCLEYLDLVKTDPVIAQLAPGRLFNMIKQDSGVIGRVNSFNDMGDESIEFFPNKSILSTGTNQYGII
ncbi:MAG: hypothetical protein ACMUIP_02825, partial [bacterium]